MESDSLPASAPILPQRGAPRKFSVKWQGKEIPLMMHNGVWRMRSRSKDFCVSFSTGTTDLAMARARCRAYLDANPVREDTTRGTLEEVARVYMSVPKKCQDATAEANISRLRSVVAAAYGSALDSVRVSVLPDLWHQYVARRQGREVADYSSRARINLAINSAMRQAASIFRPKLHSHYRKAGISLPPDASAVEYLPAVILKPAKADDAALIAAWEALACVDREMWLAIGLARFAGLRLAEILQCRGKWIVARTGGAVVELEDREEDGVRTKTGRAYSAIIMHRGLAEYLLAVEPDALVITRPNAARWLGREPQDWLRPFTGSASKPLHRLRGLYLDQVRRETEQAILARQAGIQAAANAAGHTTTETTERHYLSGE
jgi:hypothetical protein